jgi:hypothetical protein
MNSLYGRFAIRVEVSRLFKNINKKNEINNVILEQDRHYKYYNVGISSAIASYARIHIYELLKENYKNLAYIYTDGYF